MSSKSTLSKKELEELKKEFSQTSNRWSAEDVATLKDLIGHGITSGTFIHKKGIFPNRNVKSIDNKIQVIKTELGL